ncbi:LacI family DNA-binding transcriptional regulator [Virgisporangium ochraceum]|uniref:LacI family transcriptional regulator n=1 Tax=Virgisporangium ochraceum TaxID=65505 RepID=A0A8J4A002_9ACTN|nr:LacI family DNA-binding transcriptional regulator [Virgisporangium ochraceum]GIJ72393.1 LacI family transcriptional regulator [Virgisporangium ochraceum]
MIEGSGRRPRGGARRGDVPITTIAELAGVSPPTVSKVLNGRHGVGLETRRRVEALLRDHGYRRPLPTTSTPCVEVVFDRMLGSIAVDILQGVGEVAGEQDCTVGFTDVRRHLDAGEPWLDALLRRRPTAVITVCSLATVEHSERLAASGIGLVAIDPIGELATTPVVGSNNWSGALTAVRHLLDLGHRRIGVLTGPVRDLSARARLDGARAALDHAGIAATDELERQGVFTVDDGLRLGAELLALPERPTAIACGDDLQALGVYEAARRAGLRIPEDLSVVGFDDVDQAAWTAPPLTTVRQEFALMGATAARLALELAAGQLPARQRHELDTVLVVRGSTAAPPDRSGGTDRAGGCAD